MKHRVIFSKWKRESNVRVRTRQAAALLYLLVFLKICRSERRTTSPHLAASVWAKNRSSSRGGCEDWVGLFVTPRYRTIQNIFRPKSRNKPAADGLR